MEIKDMNIEQVEERKLAIVEEMKNDDADLDALEAEMRSLNERKEALRLEAEERAKVVEDVISQPVAEPIIVEERKIMTNAEIRNTAEYMDAFAEFIKTGKDAECRALLTENVDGGTIAVPDFVLDEVKTAWESDAIMSRVRKTSIPGNLKVNFEIFSTNATAHTEGSGAVGEEELTEGIVTLTPVMYKKWIGISDEVMSMRGEAFLRYIYAELAHKIVKAMADALVNSIIALGMGQDANQPKVEKLVTIPSLGTVAKAISLLSDEAENPVIIMHKMTWGVFKELQYAGNYGVDPFEGLPVLFSSSLAPAGSAASAPFMIVGDLGHGALANFPNGEGVEFKFDDLSRKKEDLVEVLGKEYAGIGVVAPNAFTLVVGESR